MTDPNEIPDLVEVILRSGVLAVGVVTSRAFISVVRYVREQVSQARKPRRGKHRAD